MTVVRTPLLLASLAILAAADAPPKIPPQTYPPSPPSTPSARPAARPAAKVPKAPVDTSRMPPEKMSVLQLREEVHRLRVQAAVDRKQIIALTEEVAHLHNNLGTANKALCRVAASPARPVVGVGIAGAALDEIKTEWSDSTQMRVTGVVYNFAAEPWSDVRFQVDFLANDGRIVSSTQQGLLESLPAGEKKRFQLALDRFKDTTVRITAIPKP